MWALFECVLSITFPQRRAVDVEGDAEMERQLEEGGADVSPPMLKKTLTLRDLFDKLQRDSRLDIDNRLDRVAVVAAAVAAEEDRNSQANDPADSPRDGVVPISRSVEDEKGPSRLVMVGSPSGDSSNHGSMDPSPRVELSSSGTILLPGASGNLLGESKSSDSSPRKKKFFGHKGGGGARGPNSKAQTNSDSSGTPSPVISPRADEAGAEVPVMVVQRDSRSEHRLSPPPEKKERRASLSVSFQQSKVRDWCLVFVFSNATKGGTHSQEGRTQSAAGRQETGEASTQRGR